MFRRLSYFHPTNGQILILLAIFLLGGIAGNAVMILLGFIIKDPVLNQNIGFPLSYAITMMCPIGYALAQGKKGLLSDSLHSRRGIPVDTNNFGKAGWIGSALLVVILTLSATLTIDKLTSLLPPMWEWLENAMNQIMNSQSKVSSFISVAVLAPVLEEILCRGIIMRGLLKRTSPFIAIVVSALIFAIIHLNPWQAIAAFILGVLMGWVYYKSGSLKLTMLMHFANNFTALLLGWMLESMQMDANMTLSEMIPANVYVFWLAGSIVVAIACIAALSWNWKGQYITKRK